MRPNFPQSRRLLATVLLFCLTLLLNGCRAESQPCIWQGRLFDLRSGTPVVGIVHVTDRTGATRSTTVQDNSLFAIELAPGTYSVLVESDEYKTSALELVISPDVRRLERDVLLERQAQHVTLAISDALTGNPLPEASARLGDDLVAAGATGKVTLTGLKLLDAGPLVIDAQGYMARTISSAELASSLDGPELQVALEPRGLVGTVRDGATNRPIADIVVTLDDQTTHSDASGTFEFFYVKSDSLLTASAPTYLEQAPLVCGDSKEANLVLMPRQVRVSVGASHSGQPVPNAVLAYDGNETPVEGIAPAALTLALDTELTASAPGYATKRAVYAGQESIQLVLERESLTIDVIDAATSQPIIGATVLVYDESLEVELTQPADVLFATDNRLTLDDPPPSLRLVAKAAGYRNAVALVQDEAQITLALQPFQARGIYVPFNRLTQPDKIEALLTMVEESDLLNAIVVDVKGDRCYLAWPSSIPLAQEVDAHMPGMMDFGAFVDDCHSRGIYVIARMVIFKDNTLAETRPEYAVRNADGSLYSDREGLIWVDPFQSAVREYNIALALEAVGFGVDEIQFDYIRFPSSGRTSDLVYAQESTFDSRAETLADFCQQTHQALNRTPAFFSADVFGLTVWVGPTRDMGIGQRIDDIMPYVDYISPMLYPSTFGPGNLGYEEPVLYPYEVIYRSVRQTKTRSNTLVRPWLQHYTVGGNVYGLREMLYQRKGAEDAESDGWLYWNAGGKYDPLVFEKDSYELLDELPSPEWVDGESGP